MGRGRAAADGQSAGDFDGGVERTHFSFPPLGSCDSGFPLSCPHWNLSPLSSPLLLFISLSSALSSFPPHLRVFPTFPVLCFFFLSLSASLNHPVPCPRFRTTFPDLALFCFSVPSRRRRRPSLEITATPRASICVFIFLITVFFCCFPLPVCFISARRRRRHVAFKQAATESDTSEEAN